MMVDRIVLVGVLLLALGALRGSLSWRTHRRRRQRAEDLLPPPGERYPWLILAFSTPDCTVCRTLQHPALEELTQQLPGQVGIQRIDASLAPELARRFGIFTVPSTVVLNQDGHVLAINHGAVGPRTLASQLKNA